MGGCQGTFGDTPCKISYKANNGALRLLVSHHPWRQPIAVLPSGPWLGLWGTSQARLPSFAIKESWGCRPVDA